MTHRRNDNDKAVTIAFAGGGTGGHIYPGLAVAMQLIALFDEAGSTVRIVWIGSKNGMDSDIVSKAVFASGRHIVDKFYGIRAGKLRRYFSLRNAADVFMVALGFWDAIRGLKKERPALLFSKGGFVSVPPCAAAKLLGIKVFTHECDFTPGLATRLNCRVADRVLLSYEETARYIKERYRSKTVVTGNPVREVFYSAAKSRGKAFLGITEKDKPIILFMGGSQGAKQINTLVEENMNYLLEHFIVVHQTGENRGEESAERGQRKGYYPYQFIYSQMPDVAAAADIVVSRAGASSIWECAVLQKPMVLIPLCGEGTRGDQVDNAKYFAQKGAAIALCGNEATGEQLRRALETLDDNARGRMSAVCASLTKTMSAQVIAKMIYDEIALDVAPSSGGGGA